MKRLAVTGYASLDYVVGLAGHIQGDQTTLIDRRDPAAWPRAGGCPAYLAIAAVRAGEAAHPVTWIGADRDAEIFLDELKRNEVDTTGVFRLPEKQSPTAILAYQKNGSCACLFDPAFTGREQLSDEQRKIIAAASHLCVSVGPPQLIEIILEIRKPDCRLYWVAKNDEHCFSPAICRTLSSLADVIFCSQSERQMIGKTGSDAVIVETRGPDQVQVEWLDRAGSIPVERISAHDATGAGDSLAGGYIAAEMSGICDPFEAARRGVSSARQLLESRIAGECR